MSSHDFISAAEAHQDELHEVVHQPTLDWFDYVREHNISPDYYLSSKVSQAVRCLAFEMYCNTTGKTSVDTEQEAGMFSFYTFMISLGAATQAAVNDGDLVFAEVEESADGS